MSNAFAWRVGRLLYFARRVMGSIAQRGVRGALRRLLQQHRGRCLMPVASPAPISVVAPRLTDGIPHPRMLVIDIMPPDPIRDSGSLRLVQVMRLLHADGWQIDFIAADGFATPTDIARLATAGAHYRQGNPLRWLRQEGSNLDAVLLCRLPVASQYLDVIRKYSPAAKIAFDTVDLHYVREQRAAELTGNRRLRRHAAGSRRRELAAVSRSDITLVVSHEEKLMLEREASGSRVELLSNIHPVHGRRTGFDERRDLLFVGGFGHPPNADAMRWFAGEILPQLLAQENDLQLHIVGDVDDTSRHALMQSGLIVHGRIDDIEPLMQSCRVSVAPLRFGAGVKGKVNQAMSHGLPVVVTSIAAEGMFLVDEANALIADDAASFARAVLRLYRDRDLWLRLSDGALENVRAHFSIEQARETLRRVFPIPHMET